MKIILAIAAGIVLASIPHSGSAYAQNRITYGQAVEGLVQSDEAAQKVGIDTDAVRRDIQARIKADATEDATGDLPISQALAGLPNFIVQIQFDLNSDVIRPESWVTVGRIADALQHPLLASNRFLITGNTDSTGSREKNLILSQKRADAVTEMLEVLFRVDKSRLLSLGLGEENLFDKQNGKDGVNRRVELFNIGPL